MKITALITTLVLGSSSVAMARPAAPIQAPAPVPAPMVSVRDHRGPAFQPAPVYRPGASHRMSWVTLGRVDRMTNGAMSFRGGGFNREFSTLKLQSSAGKSLIQRVLIKFANGRTQTVELGQYLTASNPSITIDLQGRSRAIAKVTVVGRNARQSAFRVLAI